MDKNTENKQNLDKIAQEMINFLLNNEELAQKVEKRVKKVLKGDKYVNY